MEWLLVTEEQKEIKRMVREFLEKELKPIVKEYDEKSEFPMHVFKKIGELGLWGLDIPEEYGGPGFDLQTLALIREEFGRVDCGFTVSYGASTVGFKQVLAGGTQEQKIAMAKRLTSGEISAMCITEPQSGSDVASISTKAVKSGDEYILNGTKAFITNGGIADVYIVVASTEPSKGAKGLSCFIVDRDTKGITIGKEENKMGIRLSNTTDVVFQDVRVPKENLIGEEGEGFKIVMKALAKSRPICVAPAIGLAQRALEIAVEHCRERALYGKPIGKLQATQFKIADMEIKLQASRALMMYCAKLIDEGKDLSCMGPINKAFSAEAAFDIANSALQILGGYGYSRDYEVEKLVRDARVYSIFEGTSEVQRQIIGKTIIGS